MAIFFAGIEVSGPCFINRADNANPVAATKTRQHLGAAKFMKMAGQAGDPTRWADDGDAGIFIDVIGNRFFQ